MDEVKIVIQATPNELRHWASMLEREGCKRIQINWYYTKLIIEKPSLVLLEENQEIRPHIHRVFFGSTHCIECGVDITSLVTSST